MNQNLSVGLYDLENCQPLTIQHQNFTQDITDCHLQLIYSEQLNILSNDVKF